MFRDGKITRAEYVEAVQRYTRCMHDHGSDVEAIDSGYGYFTFALTRTATMDALDATCRKGTLRLVEPIYTGLIVNPKKANVPDLIASCLVRHRAAPASYSGRDFERDSTANFTRAPYDPEDPQVQSCLADPSVPWSQLPGIRRRATAGLRGRSCRRR